MIWFLYSCFSSFWVFCFGYLMFPAVFPFFQVQRRAYYFRLLHLLLLIIVYLFGGLLPLVFVPSLPQLLIIAPGETHSWEQNDSLQSIRIKWFSSISIDQCHYTISTIYVCRLLPYNLSLNIGTLWVLGLCLEGGTPSHPQHLC